MGKVAKIEPNPKQETHICYVCGTPGEQDEMVQVSKSCHMYRHFRCSGLASCFVCSEPIEASDFGIKANGKPAAVLVAPTDQVARHTGCHIGSPAWKANKQINKNTDLARLFEEEEEKPSKNAAANDNTEDTKSMAKTTGAKKTTAKKSAKGDSIKDRIKKKLLRNIDPSDLRP